MPKRKHLPGKNMIRYDEKYIGVEPRWDPVVAAKMTDAEYEHLLRQSLNYYNYFFTVKDLKKNLLDWMRNQKNYTKDHVRAVHRCNDKYINLTLCGVLTAHQAGMPLRDRDMAFITGRINYAIQMADPATAEQLAEYSSETSLPPKTPAAPSAPSIQDRLATRTHELLGEIEGHLDDVATKQPNSFKIYDFLTNNNVPQSQLLKYERVLEGYLAEFRAASVAVDPQIKEGYSNFKAVDFKRIIKFLEDMLAGVTQYRTVKKATKKARVKKPVNKSKQVSRMKFLKEDRSLKLVSINPVDIIGAQTLWIYNIKTRKLGKFVADAFQTLGVKGTTITGFDEAKSVSKTLRKPESQLKEFARAGKVQLRKFLDGIRSVETKLRGRINQDVVLLKVE